MYRPITVQELMRDDTASPGFLRYVDWCWKRPVYVGLPLVTLTPVLIALDFLTLVISSVVWIVMSWGKNGS